MPGFVDLAVSDFGGVFWYAAMNYSITSSARASSVGGRVRPSAAPRRSTPTRRQPLLPDQRSHLLERRAADRGDDPLALFRSSATARAGDDGGGGRSRFTKHCLLFGTSLGHCRDEAL